MSVVAKFGGSSMAQPERVASILDDRPEISVVVVSAPAGVTKLLRTYAEQRGAQAVSTRDEILDHYDQVYESMDTAQRRRLRDRFLGWFDLKGAHVPPAYHAALGERASNAYFSSLTGHAATEPGIRFSSGILDGRRTRSTILSDVQLAQGRRIITGGYYGFNVSGNGKLRPQDYALLGDGGSDRTGGIYSEVLNYNYDNYTDVDGIFTADPRIIPAARVIPELNREEVREGAHGGSGVLQGDTIVDLNGSKIITTVRNTFNPSAPGTRILAEGRAIDTNQPITAVSGRALHEVTVKDLGMRNQSGYLARVLMGAGPLGISIEHVPAAQDAVTFTVPADTPSDRLEQFAAQAFQRGLSTHASVDVKYDKGVVYMVGEALRNPRTATVTLAHVALELDRHDLCFEAVVSHPSSPSIALLLENESTVIPVQQVIHKAFIEQ